MSNFTSSWEEYRLLVIKELEELNGKVVGLDRKIQSLTTDVALIKTSSDKIDDLIAELNSFKRDVADLTSVVESARGKMQVHEDWHMEEKKLKKLQQFKLQERHWSLFLAIVAAIAAVISAIL